MKSQRQAKIMEIITNRDIETQEHLLLELNKAGFRSTQATISRDIKDLNLVKQQSDGISRYVVSQEKPRHHNFTNRLKTIFRESVVSFDVAQNIVVVKTMSGLASAAAAALDSMGIETLVGSLAGDDTVILIMRTNQAADELCHELKSMLN